MKKTYYIIGVIALIYLTILVGKAVYINYQTDQRVKKLKTNLDTLETENQNLKNQIAYVQTESFKEKEARRKLGLVKPDEKVVILSGDTNQPRSSVAPVEGQEESKKSNYKLWWEYFTKDKSFNL